MVPHAVLCTEIVEDGSNASGSHKKTNRNVTSGAMQGLTPRSARVRGITLLTNQASANAGANAPTHDTN
jgi:hypothetical protein